MSDLPKSWIEVALGELTTVSYGKALAAGIRTAGGRVPVIGSSGPVGFHSEALVDGPCLVVGRKGAAGSVHLVRESSWPIDTAYFIQPPKYISLAYLSHLLGTRQLGQLDKSTAIPSLSRDDLYRVPVPVAPRAEQTRIVAKLEELLTDLDAGVAELKAASRKLAQYRQSLLKAAVEGALTAQWRAARSAPLPPGGGGAGGEGVHEAQHTTPRQQQHARSLRSEQTPAERELWQQLRAKRFDGFKFRRQQPLGRYIVDFVCLAQRLIVELDGSQHAESADYDSIRDAWLQQQGFHVLRFWNNQWSTEREAVLEAVWRALHEELPPLPNPSPTRGEGLENETGAQLLQRILVERRARWEAKQLAKFKEQGKTPPKDWQQKYPEPVQPVTTDLPALPEGWVWASVDCLLSDIETGKSFKCIEQPPTADEIGVVKVSAVSWGEYDELESKTCTNELRVNPALMVKAGDFLFSRANTVELVGACVIAKTVSLKVMLSDKILRLALVQDDLQPWLLYLLRSKIGRRQIELLATGNQESMKNIGQERLRSIAIPLGPKDEIRHAITLVQQELTSASQQITANELALKQSTAQRQNILRAAFAGQLVPQDPNDEPASVLLERIRAERAASGKLAKARKSKEPA